MGLLDNLKNVASIVTSGAAKVHVFPANPAVVQGAMLHVVITAASTGQEVKHDGVYLDLVGNETITAKGPTGADISLAKQTFSQAYKLIALYVPHAFAILGKPTEPGDMDYRFIYYSFITLTSTGYGDITPLHPYTRSLAIFEAIAGQLYLAVLIARLVGLEMEYREAQRDEMRAHREASGDGKPTA